MTEASANAPVQRFNRRELLISLAVMLAFDLGLNLLIFNVARAHGASQLTAYLAAIAGPLVSIAVEYGRHRRFSRFSVFIIVINVLSAVLSVIGNTDGRWLIIKDSLFTGGVGLAFLVSIVVGRPLTYVLGEKFATDGTDEGVARWRALFDENRVFRRTQRRLSGVWAVALLLEAAVRVYVANTLDFDRAYNIGQVMPPVVSTLCAAFTFAYVAWVWRRGGPNGPTTGETGLEGKSGVDGETVDARRV